jgi:putative ABC transport system permease protein
VLRQGLANLHRPNNQTVLLSVALGLGIGLLVCLQLVQDSLLREVQMGTSGDQPNLVLFDIQDDQRQAMEQLVDHHGLPLLQSVPIVSMRLKQIKGRSIAEVRADPEVDTPRWSLLREYRSTYRPGLLETEELLAGEWHAERPPDSSSVPVSLEKRIAERLEVGLGDSLMFDVQGLEVETHVASLRSVNWRRVQPNFFVVFPAGVLEEAPKIHVLVTRSDSQEEVAALQRAIATEFPGVSSVDVTMVLQVLQQLVGQIVLVLRFMALFSIATGILVLVSALWMSRAQRLEEAILLRTLGASQPQIRWIQMVEFMSLGMLATVAGILLALTAASLLAHFAFETRLDLSLEVILAALAGTAVLTAAVGAWSHRRVLRAPPLEVLRKADLSVSAPGA